MRKLGSILIVTGFTFLLAGCEDVKSVDWWQSHPDEADQKVSECKKSGDDSENCRNAKDGLFRYQQLHASSPSYKDAFKGSMSKGEK
ncbi:EexN family lipoprotein (plasmid) [Erwinia amylovora]|uniref:EexN family lipoprotein n=1 Tax=Enterobacter ludwigii TaxID=299767 RepID=A0AAX3LJD6_9ENTR|nr:MULTISPECIES: EexN family lipoprotein [Enterobacterales]UDJ88652.1 EexN family lipoprotein [Erwinia amylovora]UDK91370.1 EexN family lipoprotein [Erwinia amylovora]UDK94768.1 EexN family lipoprotein [Erwinia amylovora]UER93246.1 EexN family lipoprotein [Erwinia amylovora]UOD76498.1 EexN family lipoprotein [Erwinia amylovora]